MTKPEPRTPPNRRLIPTDVLGVYRRGSRFVAITRSRGQRVKTYHRTKAEAAFAKADRQLRAQAPTSREPFDVYVERWLIEYCGRTARGLSPQTREAYAQLLRTYAVPWFGRTAIGDIRPLDVRRFVQHLGQVTLRRPGQEDTRLSAASVRRVMCPLKALLAEAYELEPVVPRLWTELDGWAAAGCRPSSPILPSRTGGHQDSHNVRRRLRVATSAVGVAWATPHTFRHTFATQLVARGYDVAIVAKVLGHRSEAFTRRTYIHIARPPRFDDLE